MELLFSSPPPKTFYFLFAVFFSLVSPPLKPAVLLELSLWEWFVVLSPSLADSDSEVRLVNDLVSGRRVGAAQPLFPLFSAKPAMNFLKGTFPGRSIFPPLHFRESVTFKMNLFHSQVDLKHDCKTIQLPHGFEMQ